MISVNKLLQIDKLQQKINHYRGLCDIAERYHKMIDLIEKEQDYFAICGFSYTARGDITSFNVNPHWTIPPSYIKQGLEAVVRDVEQEKEKIETEINGYEIH